MPAAASRRIPCGSRRSLAACAGQERQRRAGAAAHLVPSVGLRRGVGTRPEVGAGASSGPSVGLARSSEWVSRAEPVVTEAAEGSPRRPGAERLARVLARTAAPGCRSIWATRVSLAGDRRGGHPRAGVGRSRSRGLRDPSGARPSVATTRGWELVFGRAVPKGASRGGPTEVGAHSEDTQRDNRRHLPWGSFPFGESSTGDRWRAGLPDRHLPSPGFLTLSTV